MRLFEDPWGRIKQLDEKELLKLLDAETTEIAAVVLSKLDVPKAEVQIKRGENRGKTIRYVNVVRDFKPIGQLSNGQARLTVPAVDGAKLAVFVQAQGQGPIVGAALQD